VEAEKYRPNTAGLRRGGGRPKGVPNKMTTAVKDVIAGAAEELGGMARLVEWAQSSPKNEAAFWTMIYPKLLPLQLTGADGGAIVIQHVERRLVEHAPLVIDVEPVERHASH
jgi:hypothetical protein